MESPAAVFEPHLCDGEVLLGFGLGTIIARPSGSDFIGDDGAPSAFAVTEKRIMLLEQPRGLKRRRYWSLPLAELGEVRLDRVLIDVFLTIATGNGPWRRTLALKRTPLARSEAAARALLEAWREHLFITATPPRRAG